jgi:hypothetical protein
MCSGVGKSGSPAPNPITGAPADFSSFALFVTASVADGDIAPTRVDTRDRSDNFPPLSSVSLSWYIFRTNADHFIVLKEVLLFFLFHFATCLGKQSRFLLWQEPNQSEYLQNFSPTMGDLGAGHL